MKSYSKKFGEFSKLNSSFSGLGSGLKKNTASWTSELNLELKPLFLISRGKPDLNGKPEKSWILELGSRILELGTRRG